MDFLKQVGWALSWPFSWIVLVVFYYRAKAMAKRYRKDSLSVEQEDRYKLVTKFVKLFLFIKNIKINVIGREKIEDKPMLFLVNHKSNIDPLIVFKVLLQKPIPKPIFIAKQELAISKFADLFELVDVLYIDRDNLRQMAQVANEQISILKNKNSIVIFPEGTRISGDELGEFKPGALLAAYKSFSSIQPIVLYNSEGFLEKTDKDGKKYPSKKDKKIDISFLKLIQPLEFMNIDKTIFAHKLQEMMQNEYARIKQEHNSPNLSKKGDK